jgi:pimeloyl-ACP methyl ester carboxylesterase
MQGIRRPLKIFGAVIAILLLGFAALIMTVKAGWWNPTYEEVAAKHAGPPSKFVQVGEARLHVRDEGQGPIVIMLHSSMSNLRIYDEWADKLKTNYRVIRFDWPPYGLSTDPRPSRGMPAIVELLEQFVEQEGLDKFTLVGSSSGSTISVLYAAKHPERVRALALSTLPLKAPPPHKNSMLVDVMQYVHQNWTPNYLPRFYYQHTLAGLYGTPSRLKPETVDWYYETNNIPGGFDRVREYWAANQKAVWSKGAGDEAAQIKVPVLLQWGDRDYVLPRNRAGEAVAQFANAPVKLLHYPDVSHYPMIELPNETGDDLKAFIDGVHRDDAALARGK